MLTGDDFKVMYEAQERDLETLRAQLASVTAERKAAADALKSMRSEVAETMVSLGNTMAAVIAERDAARQALAASTEREGRLREALTRRRQGLQNILEFRRLSTLSNNAEPRYGALTREELDQAIDEIDAALALPVGETGEGSGGDA